MKSQEEAVAWVFKALDDATDDMNASEYAKLLQTLINDFGTRLEECHESMHLELERKRDLEEMS